MLRHAYDRMFAKFGPQHWWPAESALEVIIGTVLTQNTNWQNVERAIAQLRKHRLLDLARLHRKSAEELAPIIRLAGYFRVKAIRLKNVVDFIVNEFGDVETMMREPTQSLRTQLLDVHGIGPETADSILLYAGNKATFVVDTYTARVMKRHGWAPTDADYDALKGLFESGLERDVTLFNEYHALLVRVGKEFCRPSPKCEGCPLQDLLPDGGPLDL